MSTAHPESDERALIGSVIATRYQITGVLGTGAMGTVYRAEQVDTRTPLAIKLLRKHLSAVKEADARFRREAFVGARIAHPNCVEVWDFGAAEDGSFYLAMELLHGESLGDLLEREGPLPWRRALHIARHILRGLDHAHRESVVHRDIKPDNIFVGRQEDDPDFAKVLDFGIAKLVGDSAQHAITSAGITIGTPNYLSPEQATGAALDGRSDLYSASIVLYEMLCGKTPFGDRPSLKTLFAHVSEPPPALAAAAPEIDVPAEVEMLVRDGLAKRPDDRIGSAAEYIVRIDALLGPEEKAGQEADSPSTSTTVPRRKRHGGKLLAIGGVAVLAGVMGVVLLGAEVDSPSAAEPGPVPSVAPVARNAAPPPVPPEMAAAIKALEKGKTCAARRTAVKRLGALGHPAAIPALQKARSRLVRGKNANACLRAAADQAIAALSKIADQ